MVENTVVDFTPLSEIDSQFLTLENQRDLIRQQTKLINEKGITMPKVGDKKFGYGPKGMAEAKSEAKKTGKKMTKKAGYRKDSEVDAPAKKSTKKMSKGGMAVKKAGYSKGGMAMKKKK